MRTSTPHLRLPQRPGLRSRGYTTTAVWGGAVGALQDPPSRILFKGDPIETWEPISLADWESGIFKKPVTHISPGSQMTAFPAVHPGAGVIVAGGKKIITLPRIF